MPLVARPLRAWTAVLAVLALLLTLSIAGAAPARADDAGTAGLDWGFKQSFRNYIGDAGIELSDGVTRNDDGTFHFPVDTAAYDEDTSTTAVSLTGSVRFTKYATSTGEYLLEIVLSNPRLQIDEDEQTLYADVSARAAAFSEPAEPLVDAGEIAVATLDITDAVVTTADGVTSWSGVSSYLTADFAEVFSNFYATGQPLDDLSFAYEGEGGKPDLGDPTWTEPGTPELQLAAETTLSATTALPVTMVDVDEDDGIVYGTSQSSSAIYTYDAETLEALTGAYTPANTASILTDAGTRTFDPETGTVFTASLGTLQNATTGIGVDGNIVASRWDRDAGEWVSEVVATPAELAQRQRTPSREYRVGLAWMVWDAANDRLVALLAGSSLQSSDVSERFRVVTWQRVDGEWTETSSTVVSQPGTTDDSWFGANTVGDYSGWLGRGEALAAEDGSIVVVRPTVYGYGESGASQALSALRLIVDEDGDVQTEEITGTESAYYVRAGTEHLWLFPYPSSTASTVAYPLDLAAGEAAVVGEATAYPEDSGANSGVVIDDDAGTFQMGDLLADQFELSRDGTVLASLDVPDISLVLGASETWGTYVLASTLSYTTFTYSHTLMRVEMVGASPTITEQPASAGVVLDSSDGTGTVTFTAAAEGDPTPTVQWQSKAAGSASFADIDGATDTSLTLDVTADDNGRQFRAVFTNDAGSIATTTADLTVLTPPEVAAQPQDTTVLAGGSTQLLVMPTGNPEPTVTWQWDLDGSWADVPASDNVSSDGGYLNLTDVPAEWDGVAFRAVLTNDVGTAYSDPATLTVTSPTTPEEPTTYDGVAFDWTVSADAQHRPPNGSTAHYFSAGMSDGTEATYAAETDGVVIWQRDGSGGEEIATWDTRGQHVTLGGSATQAVELTEGTAVVEPDGSAVISWPVSFSINYYDGLVPFTLSNLVLTVDADGVGTLTADLSGYEGDISDPYADKAALDPVSEVTVATFSGVVVDTAGSISVTPDYAGVEVTVPDGTTAQDQTSSGWGAWPQGFVDFHQGTGLAAYFYSTGGTLDVYKAPASFTVDFTDAAAETTAPTVTAQPVSVSVTEGEDAVFTASADGTPVPTVQWQSKLADAGDWVDIAGATDASYTAAAVTASASGTQYRAVFTNSAGTATTDAATLTVAELPSTGGDDGDSDSGSDDSGSGGTGSGSSWSASEDDLTGVDQGGVSVPSSAAAGATILVTVGGDHEGETVHAYLFSDPVSLGSHVVSTAGTISVTLPSDVTGEHRIAVYAADGTLIGWAPITITDPGALAVTGGGFPAGAVWAGGVLVLLGAAAVGAGLRRRAV
ncbi:MAG: HtaA domain-containing protein [Microbacterium sp.]|uniref:HtaA domain-containing protein n=1 Tax=Microbacterium sp. TaxID=51671 RepID=UPI0039E57384